MSVSASGAKETKPPRLLDQLRHQIRLRHYSYRTEQAYIGWAKRFIRFHNLKHPAEMGGPEVESYLSYLASDRNVAAATQSQALSAVMFLYKAVLKTELPWLQNVVRATRPRRLPVVLTQAETRSVLGQLEGVHWLVASLLYGSGLRVLEALRLRVKDIDLKYQQLTVRDGKGAKDRVTVLPAALVQPLTAHLARVQERHALAIERGFGGVDLPFARCGNIRELNSIGRGNTYFHQPRRRSIRAPGQGVGITCWKRISSGRCGWRRVGRVS